ncbi:Oligoendopeptidase F [Nymphon striatum]|nr:Oligoendopeptidase F [Nymphon striatum]
MTFILPKPTNFLAKSAVYSPETAGAGDLDETLLPQWNLDDLYTSIDAPTLIADLEQAQTRCVEFEDTWKGKLSAAVMNNCKVQYLMIHLRHIMRLGLNDLRKEKPYQLEDRVEQLFHEKSLTGRGAFNRLFDETTNGLRFNIDGEDLPLERAFNHLQDADEHARSKAFKSISTVFDENIRTFALITNTLAKDKEISDRWRGFEDVADSRHLDNRVEREVVDALVAAVRESYPRISHRYYAMKAKWLGMEKLQAWDRNAPLPETPDALVGWPEAKNIVLSAYNDFLPEMADTARQFFDKNWIDAPARDGKAPGAFAHPTVPSAHPYVLLNYLGKPRDVMTLAHELGHGVHQVLAAEQGALMASTPLTLAETASVFGEMLTFRFYAG